MKFKYGLNDLNEADNTARTNPQAGMLAVQKVITFSGQHLLDKKGNPIDIPKWNLWAWAKLAWKLFKLIQDIIELLKK